MYGWLAAPSMEYLVDAIPLVASDASKVNHVPRGSLISAVTGFVVSILMVSDLVFSVLPMTSVA